VANSARSLGRLVPWLRVLPVLGVEVSTGLLPATTTCPLCRGDQLQLVDDGLLGGQWCCCRNCHFAGDLFELTARAWNISIQAAVVRLAELELLAERVSPEHCDGYVRDHVQYRRRMNEFWVRAQQNIKVPKSATLVKLVHRFGLRDQTYQPDWLSRMGQFVGSAHYKEVENLFHRGSYAEQPRVNHDKKTSVRRGAGPGDYRLFHGDAWDDVLIVPYFDMPGRICGFLIVGRDADPGAGDILFKPGNFQPATLPLREAGFGMWQAMAPPLHPALGDALFVINDPLVALTLQGRSYRDSFQPLPIVMSHCDARVQTKAALTHLPHRKVIFWGTDPGTLKQAKAVGGWVSTYPISDKEIQRNLHHHEPYDWLRLILKRAVPWQIAFRERLRRMDQPTLEALIDHMQLTPDELRELAAGPDQALRERLEHLDTLHLNTRKVQVGKKTVVETEVGWTLERTGEVVCNAAIRVEEVLHTSDDTTYYHGTVRFNGADHAYTVASADVDRRGLLRVIREFLIAEGVGFLQYHPDWVKPSAHIAMTLGKPMFRDAVDRIGWHSKERRFVFPRFCINTVGEVSTKHLPVLIDNPPAADLMPPMYRPFMPEELESLCADRPEVSMFWAMAASVLHNLLAPAANRNPAGIVLDGPGAQAVGPTLAKALGCAEMDLRRATQGYSALERINVACSRHGWPVVASKPLGRFARVTAEWAEADGPRNAVLSLNQFAALSLATTPGFNVIYSQEPAAPLDVLRQSATRLVPAYVQHVCERRLWIGLKDVRMPEILADLADWFQGLGGDAAAVRRADRVLYVGGHQPWRPFLELVFRLYAAGQLDLVRDGFQPGRPLVPVIVYRPTSGPTPPSYVVPTSALNRVLGRVGAPGVNFSDILKSLQGIGAPVEAIESGWDFKADWWTERYYEHCRQGCETQVACVEPGTPVPC